MRVSTKRILSIMLAILFFIGAFVVYLKLIKPEIDVINEKRGVALSKSNLLSNQSEIVNQVQTLIGQFQNVARLQETIALAVPSGDDAIDALRQIEAISRNANTHISSIDFKRESAPSVQQSSRTKKAPTFFTKRLSVLNVALSVEGTSYEDIKRFVSQLETSVRVANITDLRFSPASGRDTKDSLSLTVEMYYQEL